MVFNRKPDPRGPDASISPISPYASAASGGAPVAAQPVPENDFSVIGSDLVIEGNAITMRCQGVLRVNGSIQADVHSRQLVVGDKASVNGSITADMVKVHGRIKGSVHGARVVLHSTAQVEGDIHSGLLSIEEGASFDGRARKVRDPKEIAPQLTPSVNTTIAAVPAAPPTLVRDQPHPASVAAPSAPAPISAATQTTPPLPKPPPLQWNP